MTNVSNSGDHSNGPLTPEERELGMSRDITRRDFLNAAALGTGAALLSAAAPSVLRAATQDETSGADTSRLADDWSVYPGIGDYARSNGNTLQVVTAGHGIRDHKYEAAVGSATATGEIYDLLIVGGGYAGVVSAYRFLKETQRKKSCLILENHPIMGGEAKRNEFMVQGQRLIGPQGSNEASVPTGGLMGEIWKDVGLPTQFEFAKLPSKRRMMEFPYDNYMYLLWADKSENLGYYFDSPQPHWVTNPWGHDLANTPWPAGLRREMLRWRDEPAQPFNGNEEGLQRWLDTMTYEEYLVKVRKLDPEVAKYVDPIVAVGLGLGSDVISANAAYYFSYPGFTGLSKEPAHIAIKERRLVNTDWIFSFPGGNDGTMRGLLKWLNPEMIEGSTSFPDFYFGPMRFDSMDQAGLPCRMRTSATVVRIAHESDSKAKPAIVTYAKDGRLYSVRAKSVIWAGASFTAKHAIPWLPDEYRSAMAEFVRAPILVANVALNNWRFLYKLGYTACSWSGGFGYTANIVSPMHVGDYRPPLDPDSPIILTFYVPFNQRGKSLADQGNAGRAELLGTTYREYEAQIRRQMLKLFGNSGFDADRDIAGIVLNRWGHAYVTAGPGFFYGRDGKPAPSDVLRRPVGNLTFAHSELSGHQNSGAAALEGSRAAKQVLSMM